MAVHAGGIYAGIVRGTFAASLDLRLEIDQRAEIIPVPHTDLALLQRVDVQVVVRHVN